MTQVHYLSMLLLGIGTFIFGILPIGISRRITGSASYYFILTLTLCLGAGVLLATSLVHMLTEVQEKLKAFSQLYFCGGFLILYTFDEISHYFLGRKGPELCSSNPIIDTAQFMGTKNYGAISNAERALLPITSDINYGNLRTDKNKACGECSDVRTHVSRNIENSDEGTSQQTLNSHCQDKIKCLMIGEPCYSNFVTTTGLLLALFTHSVLEGISIGVQTDISQVMMIVAAVSVHKLVLSFCLGLELCSNEFKHFKLVIIILLFSFGSPVGIFTGMCITSSNGVFKIDSQLQAVAAGSLFYVAAFEVLPRERFKWQHRSNRKVAGLFQLLFLLIGFVCITCLHLFIGEMSALKKMSAEVFKGTKLN